MPIMTVLLEKVCPYSGDEASNVLDGESGNVASGNASEGNVVFSIS